MSLIRFRILLLLSSIIPIAFNFYSDKLRFKEGQEFVILQITDLHFGETVERDENTNALVEKLIKATKPDVVAVTGDAVSGYCWDGKDQHFYQNLWKNWTKPFTNLKVPYFLALGNHDRQGNLNPTEICELDHTHEYSLTEASRNITGASNYHFPIYSSNASNPIPPAMIWVLDTNMESCDGLTNTWGCIEKDQVEWYKKESQKINEQYGVSPDGLAFYHIPLPEFVTMHNWGKTYGYRGEGISCPRVNTHFFTAMLEMKNIKANFFGHDHCNDNGGFLFGIEIAYGRKTGFGCYGPDKKRGGRVIKLKEKYDEQTNKLSFDYRHYIVDIDNEITIQNDFTWRGGYDFLDYCDK